MVAASRSAGVKRGRVAERSRLSVALWWGALLFVPTLGSGCGGYARSVAQARHALEQGKAERAQQHINQALEDAPDPHLPLLHLERAIARHQLGDLRGASADYQLADDALEVLDYTSATAEEVSSYLYSDDAAPYRPPAYEKALINLLNLMSYLERGDLSGARVEGKRFLVYVDYFKDLARQGEASMSALTPLLGLGASLGAYTALSLKDLESARRWSGSYEQLNLLIDDELAQQQAPQGAQRARLLILSASGLIAHKRPVRLGLGSTLMYLSAHPGHGMSASEHRALQRSALSASVKWVNFVELTRARPHLSGEGQLKGLPEPVTPLFTVNLSALASAEFKRSQAKMLAAAVTRLLTRSVIGAGSKSLAKRQLGPLGGLLVGLAVEGGLSAADTPDTRGWSALPDQLSLYWLSLPPGEYRLSSLAPNSTAVHLSLKAGERRALSLPRHPISPTQRATTR